MADNFPQAIGSLNCFTFLVPGNMAFSWHWEYISRLCSNGAWSPQVTNIWSWATEKEKQSPVQAPRFRLVWKPETKPANVLKRNGTKQKETSLSSRAHVSPKNKSAERSWVLFRFDGFSPGFLLQYMAQLSCPLNDAIRQATYCN